MLFKLDISSYSFLCTVVRQIFPMSSCRKSYLYNLTLSRRVYYIFFWSPVRDYFQWKFGKKFLAIKNSLWMKRCPDNQINSSFADISRIKWLVFLLRTRETPACIHVIQCLSQPRVACWHGYRQNSQKTECVFRRPPIGGQKFNCGFKRPPKRRG